MTRKCPVRFGGGPSEQGQQWHLAGGLPDYERPASQMFLAQQGYQPASPGVFVKARLSADLFR